MLLLPEIMPHLPDALESANVIPATTALMPMPPLPELTLCRPDETVRKNEMSASTVLSVETLLMPAMLLLLPGVAGRESVTTIGAMTFQARQEFVVNQESCGTAMPQWTAFAPVPRRQKTSFVPVVSTRRATTRVATSRRSLLVDAHGHALSHKAGGNSQTPPFPVAFAALQRNTLRARPPQKRVPMLIARTVAAGARRL